MVYHYTTIETFYSMLANYKASEDKDNLIFWASNVLNQNDPKEMSLRLNDIISAVKQIEKEKPQLTELRKLSTVKDFEWLFGHNSEKVEKNINKFCTDINYAPFTISFSHQFDKLSDEMQSAHYQDRTFVPNYINLDDKNCFALNVNNYYVTNSSTDKDGSKFIKGLRSVRPFEAYMTTTSNTRSIDVLDGMATAIKEIMKVSEGTNTIKVYDTKGVLVKTIKANDNLRRGLANGVYIVNGKKMIKTN